MSSIRIKSREIKIIQGDITVQEVDAIVNAANTQLKHAGGVARAIATKAGPTLVQESNQIGQVDTGKAVITTGGNLPSKYVIHAVGPIWHGGERNEPNLLRSCVLNSLRIAEEYNLQSIAFPAISTGIYNFPINRASEIFLGTTVEFLQYQAKNVKEILFVLFKDSDFSVFKEQLSKFT